MVTGLLENELASRSRGDTTGRLLHAIGFGLIVVTALVYVFFVEVEP